MNNSDQQAILARMRELTAVLNDASRAYYQEDREIMSNYEYDALYDELTRLESKTGIILAGSPTQQVGYEVVSSLPKVPHDSKMLSLDKTKDPQALADWLGSQTGLLSWKMDGLTVVLTYRGGQLEQALTRGNGEVGEVITANARTFENLPARIPFEGELVIRGEAVIRYSDFERINALIPDADARYKNPRNLCSGSVRQLNSAITAQRHVHFFAFTLVQAEGMTFDNSRARQMEWLKEIGFSVVSYRIVRAEDVLTTVQDFGARIEDNDFPSDGLVLTLDDIAYSASLGTTAKFPRDAIAFKWADETAETVLREVFWSASRTGLINPVAVFDPVELEGTTVTRASLHNISVIRGLKLGIGDHITVYKANMIIPQIAQNLTESDALPIPQACPVCGRPTCIKKDKDSEVLFCENDACPAKQIKAFALFVSRDAFNIEGLSEATLEKLIAAGCIHTYADLFALDQHRETIISMDGFGQKSFENLMAAIERSKTIAFPNLIYSLGIPGVGLSNARLLAASLGQTIQGMIEAKREDLEAIQGVGPVLAASVSSWFSDPANLEKLRLLLDAGIHVTEDVLAAPADKSSSAIAGKTFVITGSLNHYENRSLLKKEIESLGGKVASAVSSKTDYLINNDNLSGSAKNKKAKELGIPVITEEDWLQMKKS